MEDREEAKMPRGWLNATWLRIRTLIHRKRLDRDLEDEIAFHLAMREEKYRQEGIGGPAGRAAAHHRFGNPTLYKETSRDMWTFRMWTFRRLETVLQDLQYGLRILAKNPGFTAIAIVTLALGIGANSAVFSVVNGVLLNAVPFRDSGRLVTITEMEPFLADAPVSPEDFCDWKAQADLFERIVALEEWRSFSVTGGGPPEQVPAYAVSTDYFQMLGVTPALGRDFSLNEDELANQHTALISYALWQRRFGGDRGIVGQAINLSDESYSILGVMPQAFKTGYPEPQVWVPISCQSAFVAGSRGSHFMGVLAKLKPGVTIARAQAEMDTIASRLQQQYPDSNDRLGAHVIPLTQAATAEIRPGLLLLLSAVGFVLLIACANVANLQLVRASARQRELAVRAAIGATRGRLVRQLLVEGLLLALAGGAGGLLLAYLAVPLLVRSLPESVSGTWNIAVDGRIIAFTIALSVVTALLFGIAPAFQSSRPNLNDALASSQRYSAGSGHRRLRNLLVVAETSLALVLLIGAGLMFRSFMLLQRDNPGFNPHNVLTMGVDLPEAKYPTASSFKPDVYSAWLSTQRITPFFNQALKAIEALPGVTAAGGCNQLPGQNGNSSGLAVTGQPAPKGARPLVGTYVVTPGYFRAAEIPLVEGRVFADTDEAKGPPVVVIDRRLSDQFFPGQDAVGQRVSIWGADRQIVGVVGNVKEHGFNENMPEIYFPFAQIASSSLALVVRTGVGSASLGASVTGAIQSIDSDQPVHHIRTLEQIYDIGLLQTRLSTALLVVFALLALVLAGVGTYGVVSYTASQRTHEIGIRMAMGATRHDVMQLVVGQGARLALIGVGIGLIMALVVTRWMASLLFQVSAKDPATFVVVAILLTGVALLACYFPARRATSVDPMSSLRCE
jgi:putative ABC transport system permease protein